jgi:Tfp pilus assembly major pilin PilA
MADTHSIEQKLVWAENEAIQCRYSLRDAMRQIATVPAFAGQDVQANIEQAITDCVRAAARAELLRILSTEDFFHLMATSAGAGE